MGVGMPQSFKLQAFGDLVCRAFNAMPYHVGSSVEEKIWRDVDVRLMLPDEKYKALFGDPDPHSQHYSNLWRAMNEAFSALGKEMTGLPIDFQFQDTTRANAEFGGKIRSALFNHHDVQGSEKYQSPFFDPPQSAA